VLVHIVLARFPQDGDAEEAERLLQTLPAKIDVIRSLVAGQDVVRSDRSYDLGWIVELDSEDDLATYADHPAHQEVAQWITEHRTDIAVCDFMREG
jgi:Stress responsive A/B Barrel Domain